MEWYSITKVSQELGVSRQSIYNKLKDDSLKDLTSNTKDSPKGKMINTEGVNLLRKIFNEHLESKSNVKIDSKFTVKDESVDLLIQSLKSQIDNLQEQVSKQNQLIENSQILLKNEQEKNKLLLESSINKPKWWQIWK